MSDVTILDGGMGKELRRIGAPFRQPEWSSLALIEAPEMVTRAHRNFVDAGAQIIITNNYAVVPFHHSEAFFEERGVDLVSLAGRLARDVADSPGAGRSVRVAGSMPPLFGSYEPEKFDQSRAAPIYCDIAAALAPFVDLWIGETMSSVAEMRSIIAAIETVDRSSPIWMSFALPDQWDPDRGMALRSGEGIETIAAAASEYDRVEALLFNCSIPEQTGPALAALRRELDRTGGQSVRTGGYANAFPTAREETYQANEVIFERRDELTGERYSEFVGGWIEAGATIVGGCCDMYPEHIESLAARFG